MNILLLSNGAPNYHNFFNALAGLFIQDGATVVAAVDCRFSREENRLDQAGFAAIHDFSEFFANHRTDPETLARYSMFNLNSALLSDFERSEAYGVWGHSIDNDFFDRLKSALLCYFENIFDRHCIEAVLYENVSNAFAHFALFVAQDRGAAYWGLVGSRLPGRFSVTADPYADDGSQAAFEQIRAGELSIAPAVHQWVDDYIAGIEHIMPDYMKNNGLDRISIAHRYLRRDRFAKLVSLARHAFDSRTAAFQIGNPLLTYTNLFWRNIRRRVKCSQVQKLYDMPVSGEKFLLYPLHFHPESSTSVLAGTYLDEYEVIRNIAFNLPEGCRLYVKDHISAWAYPSLDFYQRLKRLPNVRLMGPNEATKQLIKASEGVITLTSTVGYEALLLKTPVLLFGQVFYSFHRGVKRVVDPTKLYHLITDILEQPVNWDDQYNHDFVCAYFHATLPGTLNLMHGPAQAAVHAREIYAALKPALALSTKPTREHA